MAKNTWHPFKGPALGTFQNTAATRNRVGTRLGHYDRGTNSTRDRWGNKIAEGNVVAGLIVDEWKQG